MSDNTEIGTFQDFVASERERLSKRRNELRQYIDGCRREVDELDREFHAINAYEQAKAGKAPAPARTARAGTRVRRGSKRDEMLTLIGAATDGMSRGEILEHMGMKGNKSGEMSVSNALTNLIKRGQIERHAGRYYVPAIRGEAVSYQQEPAVYEAAK